MRGLVISLLILVIIASFSFVAVSINSEIKSEKPEIKNPDYMEFKTFTSAVCENKNELVYCKDELFVNCNGKIFKAGEIGECNGISLPKGVSGSAVFEKGWKDPRI